MANIKGGLFSLSQKGTIGDAITFTSNRGKPYVRMQSKRKQPRSVMQIGMRALQTWISQEYKNLSEQVIETWRVQAEPDNITPLNAWLRDAQKRQQVGLPYRQFVTQATGIVDAPTALEVTAEFRSLKLAWTRPFFLRRGNWSAAVYLSQEDDLTGVINQLRIIVPVTQTSVQITKLTSGQTVFLAVRETRFNGRFGPISAAVSTTIK